MAKNRVVGIFGGTFDPPHLGHKSLIRSFLNSSHIDELWVIPALESPHKVGASKTDYIHRFAMCKLAFSNIDKLQIKNTEASLPKPSYTFQTITYLKAEVANTDFVLCLGIDSLYSFDKWYKWEDILNEVSLLVAERKGIKQQQLNPLIQSKAIFVEEHEAVAYSSTKIKETLMGINDLQRTSKNLNELGLSEEIITYINEHQLYSAT